MWIGFIGSVSSRSMPVRPSALVTQLGLAAVLSACLFATASSAQDFKEPVYDPVSKSYFELRNDNGGAPRKPASWGTARLNASKHMYKGRRGRLAVVKTQATHEFLRRNFPFIFGNRPTGAWIGLRYWCKFRRLQWVTGEFFEPGSFGPWAPQWYRVKHTSCSQRGSGAAIKGYMPVYYLPTDRGFQWQASGPLKHFTMYIIEYPAGPE